MSAQPIDLSEASAAGPAQSSRKSKASRLWKFLKRDPPLGAAGTNPKAQVLAEGNQAPWFRVKGNASLIERLEQSKKISQEDLAEARQIALEEGLSYNSPSAIPTLPARSQSGTKRLRSDESLHRHFDTRRPSKEEADRINRALLLFFVMCNIPFPTAANPWFLAFVLLLRPLYEPPENVWDHGGQSAPPQDGLMTYEWPEGLLPLGMDDLGLLTSAAPNVSEPVSAPQSLQPSIADEMVLRKRKRERADQEDVESILAQLGREEDDDSPYEDKRPARTTSGTKTSAASAARNKACRERQRRERLNDRFSELAKVLEPGKAAKTDKTNIIDDAMRIVTQLRGENGQLRQLNKFLEERVAQCEKTKSEMLLQQALMQQSAGLAGPSSLLANTRLFQPALGPGIVQGVAVGLPMKPQQPAQQLQQAQQSQQLNPQGSGQLQPQAQAQNQGQEAQQQQRAPSQQQQAQPQPQAPVSQGQTQMHNTMLQPQHPLQLQSQASLARSGLLQLPPGMALPFHAQQFQHLQAPQQQQQQPAQPQQDLAPHGGTPDPEPSLPFLHSIKQEYSQGLMLPGSLPFTPNLGSWLPPSTLDTSQDSLRRPPAA